MKLNAKIVIFFFTASIESSSAGLILNSINHQQTTRPYARIDLKDGKSYWISAEQLNANGTAATSFLLQEMNCISRGKTKKIKTPDTYMILAPLSESIRQNTLVTGVNFHGQWSVIQLSANLSSVRQAQPLIDMGFVWASATSRTGYFIAGTSVDKRPTLIYLSADLKNKKTLSQADDHNGEVSNVFESKGRIFHCSTVISEIKTRTHLPERNCASIPPPALPFHARHSTAWRPREWH
ncbi:hypothetical protein [Verminephrobacter aporrectodeae]|uniref:hypothetical protein n=1 Tax=Verminephrobacter aporrectodeae TaxID=1110389 RepID=UPI001110A38F|nr:hypothetical protein [Verminephrobacter aporrectodeae]